MDNRDELREFLTTRRARVIPHEAGVHLRRTAAESRAHIEAVPVAPTIMRLAGRRRQSCANRPLPAISGDQLAPYPSSSSSAAISFDCAAGLKSNKRLAHLERRLLTEGETRCGRSNKSGI